MSAPTKSCAHASTPGVGVVGGILRGSEDVEDVAQQALAKAYFRYGDSICGRRSGPGCIK